MCILTMSLGTTLTTALASSLVSAGFSTTAAAVTSGVVVGAGLAAVDGAVMGAAASGITGNDIGEGALQGLWMGAAGGAIGGGLVQGLGAAGLFETGALNAAEAAQHNANLAASAGEGAVEMNGEMFAVVSDTTGEHLVSVGKLAATDGTSLLQQGLVSGEAAADSALNTANAATKTGEAAEKSSSLLNTEDLVKGGASAGVQLVGSGIEAYGAYQEGLDNSEALKKQAEQQRIAAQSVLDSAEIEAKDLSRRQRQVIGKGKVAAAANGVMLEGRAESSPAMYEQDAASEAAWDRSKLFTNANMRAQGLFATGNDMLVNAKRARRSGNLKAATSAIKGVVGAGVSLYGDRAVSLYA